ncbi:hypothetical protein AT244_00120 [Bartonella henselae]|nr:hypothetical protein AT244_00120 [Bartonella henselae]
MLLVFSVVKSKRNSGLESGAKGVLKRWEVGETLFDYCFCGGRDCGEISGEDGFYWEGRT